eukprot:scaffold10356_cov61-Phaeocystis_antarctica.AAC.7
MATLLRRRSPTSEGIARGLRDARTSPSPNEHRVTIEEALLRVRGTRLAAPIPCRHYIHFHD